MTIRCWERRRCRCCHQLAEMSSNSSFTTLAIRGLGESQQPKLAIAL
ncbi:hypothetical protein [Nostoc sp.]|nr:hypothetical protein [Nostoc sp.]